MNMNQGISRIAAVLQLLGFVPLVLGVLAMIHRTEHDQIVLAIIAVVCASPFFAVAWILDGFVSKEQREADALIAQMRRNYEMGRRALERHPDA